MPSFARPLCLISLLGCAALTVLVAGCDPEPAGLSVTSISPQPVEQTGLLHIFGEDFGEFVQDRSGVLVSGVCAHVALWRDDRLAILVPEGIGTGVRVLQIHRADGSVVTREVVVTGQDLPFTGERPTCRFAAGIPGGGGGGGGEDVVDVGDDGDLGPQPDTALPDFVSSCPIAVSPGACVGDDDCSALMSLPEDEFTMLLFECAQPCVVEGDQMAECTGDCIEFRLGLSNDCASCYGEAAACILDNCLADCLADPQASACERCRADNCLPAKLSCTGVRYETFGDVTPPPADARYLRLVSVNAGGNDATPGAEIDAVQIERIDGENSFAADVVRADPGDGVRPGDPSTMIGAPDAFPLFPDLDICQTFGTWAMGGRGSAVLGFERAVSPGDRIQVMELGDCELIDAPDQGLADAELVEVSIGESPDGPFVTLGVLRGPADSLVVP